MLFNKDNSIKKADPRKIISILDRNGNHGKSSFFKYLLIENSDDVGRVGYVSAGQLRSRAMNMGPKKIYIIDLARTKSKGDSGLDILSTIEDLKSGLVISTFYGRANSLIMDPPTIIISSNYEFDYESLSKDRWLVYEIRSRKPHGLKQIKNIYRNKKIKTIKKELGSSQIKSEMM